MKVFWRALIGAYEHGAISYSKGAAYSALLSFFPVLTTLTTILVQANAERVSRKIVETLFNVVPTGTQELVQAFFTARGVRPITLPVVAVILALWAASGVMMSLMEGFQATLKLANPRGIIRQRLMAVWLVLVGILPVVFASAMMLFGERTELTILRWLGLLQWDQTVAGGVAFIAKMLRYALVLITVLSVNSMFYFFGPAAPRKGRQILPGAILSTVLWMLVTWAFTWYVRDIAKYNVLYGSIGAVIALLVWMYLLSLISLIGFEYNVARSNDSRKR